jgi:hypothetical protein
MRRGLVETRGFSADRARLEKAGELSLEDLVALEQAILADPEIGDLVRGTGGLRKVRLGQRSVRRGKRGGARVFYQAPPGSSAPRGHVPARDLRQEAEGGSELR